MVIIKLRKFLILTAITILIISVSPLTYAQESGARFTSVDEKAVVLSGEPLFVIQSRVGSFSPEERAQAVTKRIQALAEDVSIPVDAIKIDEQSDTTSIVAGDRVILTLTDADARAEDTTRQLLGEKYLTAIKDSIQRYRNSRSLKSILLGAFYSLFATLIFIIILKILGQLFSRLDNKLNTWRGTRIPALRIRSLELLPAAQITDILSRCVKFIGFVLNVGLFYGYTTLVLNLFPWTQPIGASLSRYLLAVLNAGWQAFLSYVPNLFVIALVIIITYYLLQFVKFIFVQLGRARDIPWFYPEWAEPTYKLATFLVIAFAVIVVFPYLPGSQSPAFQGVSVFLGLLLSLGSSSAIANVVAGVILIYTRAFHVGDRVKIGEAIGDIVEKTLLVTQIRTIKNVVITIPNATVLNSQIVNYSALAQDPDNHLILHTTITLGYDLPWRKVHEALINAASRHTS